MRYEKLDLNLLVALEILLDERSITKSAYRLHLSQSATSGVLSRLRLYFEDDLLVQMGKKMHMTPYALELQKPVSEVLATIRSSIIEKKLNKPELSQRNFKIVTSDYMVLVLLSHVLADISKIAPNITFELSSIFTGEIENLVKSGADLVIAPSAFSLDNYSSVQLTSDEFICIADENNSLLKDVDYLNTETYTELGHVALGYDKSIQLSIEKWMVDTVEINRRVEVFVNDFSSMLYTVLNTDRVAIMPKQFAENHAKHLPLKLFDIPFKTPALTESMMWHPTLENDPMHKWLREKIIEHATALKI